MAADQSQPAVNGLAGGLIVTDRTGWTPATSLTSGTQLDALLDAARVRWGAAPPAAAALAWKAYSYWVALPAVLGYAAARRLPLLGPEAVLVRWSPETPFLQVGLDRVAIAVLPTDPLAIAPPELVRVVPDESALRAALRTTLVDQHFELILDQLRRRVHIGRRTLLGSVASGIAHGLSRAASVLPGPVLPTANELLTTLGLQGLVSLAPRPGGGIDVHRHTCCLAFTLPRPKICAGCVIADRPAGRSSLRSAH